MLVSISKTLILLFLLLLPAGIRSAPSSPGLDTYISDQFRRDPQGANDTFLSLPAFLKRSLSSTPHPTLSSILDYLRSSITVPVPVYVKLIGPFSPAAPSLLLSFITSAYSSSRYQVIGHKSHRLAASHSLHLEASLSSHVLGSRIYDAVKAHIATATSPFHRSALFPVPYAVVDDIVKEEFQKEEEHSAPGFFIYLLNLGSQAKPYAYSYDGRDSSASPSFSRCMGSLWTGDERYLWIDLSAGPVDYGPALSGEGLLPRSEFHPLAAIHGRPKSERMLLADLSSLVLSAYRSLLVPSLRIPAFYDSPVTVRFIHIHGSDPLELHGLNWNIIEMRIRDAGLLMRDQVLKFDMVRVKYSECPICSFAVAKSTHSFTSRFLFDNHTLIVSEYLDSKRLHQILSDSAYVIHKLRGIGEEEVGNKVIPVYVFDLDYDKLLMLDRYHQAVAFRNMVIAVRTRTSQSVSDYSCNGRHVITLARELERPIISSILQTQWGVSPTHMSWSPQHNDTLVDYTWSVGHTPFGPFTESTSLSFVQKDAARRNMLLTTLNYTITSAIDVISSMVAHGGDRKLLKNNKHVEFVQRWNLLKYKIDKAVSSISHLDFEKALYYLRSSDHDLYAIHNLIYVASQALEASLVCFQDPPFPWTSVSVTTGILLAFFYAYLKRDKLFTNKRKQF